MSTPSGQTETIVDEALDLPPADRAAYLDKVCGTDALLRQRVEALLRAHQHAPTPRSRPTPAPSATSVSDKPGDKIGRYKLREQIGEGGCGVVYGAEQEEPVRRRVALKVIKLGMDTKQVVARFEAERQVLALLDHPNIAKVLDAGATEAGRPYFVMELVRGIRITDYCDQNNLSTEERLKLFTQVCQAIQHAHQKGIIHRDIKPSNILVTLHDGVPVPKVIDFGIAKATAGQTLTDKTLFTALEQFIGTPAYMSPEQAHLTRVEIDKRSDVYSLGVLLYELLTGKTPFDSKRLVQAGLDEVRRIIREEDPVKPSTRLSTLELAERTIVARSRQCEPPKLVGLIRGDLDWIVMKTLEKDRNRRYETANGLAADIKRFLRSEPIVARPPGKLYRFGKLVRRRKLAFGAATAVLSVLLVAGGVMAFALKLARQGKMTAATNVKRIAVLPFTNTSPDLDPYISDSLTTEVINGLRKVSGLNAFRVTDFLAGASTDQICEVLRQQEMPVPLFVEGRVEVSEGKITIVCRLIETAVAGGELLLTNYQCEPGNLLGVPSDLALRIAEHAIKPLPPEARNLIKKEPTLNPKAYDCYLRGRYDLLVKSIRQDHVGTNSIPLLEQAVELDSQFALSYAMLSRAYVAKYFYLKPEEIPRLEPEATKAFERALKLDTNLAEAHFAKGYFFWTPSQHWNVREAIKEERQALILSRDAPEVSDQLALIYLHIGLFEEALFLTTQAAKSNPLNRLRQSLEANALFWQGRDLNAVQTWQRIPSDTGASFIMNSYQVVALINLGRTNDAVDLINRALRADPGDTGGLFASARAILRAKQGDEAGATNAIADTLTHRKRFGHFHHAAYNIAAAYALLNKPGEAMKFLRDAAGDGFQCYPFFQVDTNLSSLRTNADFQEFLKTQEKIHKQFKTELGERPITRGAN